MAITCKVISTQKMEISNKCENFVPNFDFFRFLSLIKWYHVTLNTFWTKGTQIENVGTEKTEHPVEIVPKKSKIWGWRTGVLTANGKSYGKTDSGVESAMKFWTKCIYSGLFRTLICLKKTHLKYDEMRENTGKTPHIRVPPSYINKIRALWNDNFVRPLSSSGRKMIETCGLLQIVANLSLCVCR